ncbi:hypothetical protein M3231_06675 [Neobacillus mesonae]|nr:hypothetical protein [Neobacillus mesonae]
MYYLLAILFTFPVMMSIASSLWGKVLGDPTNFPAHPYLYRILITAQILCALVVFIYHSAISFLILSLVYLAQCVGVLVLIHTKGKVECGCLGPQVGSRLSYSLVLLNLLFTLAGCLFSYVAQYMSNPVLMLEGAFIFVMLLLLALLVVVGIPDARYAIKAYRAAGAVYHPTINKRGGNST